MSYLITVMVTADDIGPVTAQLANQFGEVRVEAMAYRQGLDAELDVDVTADDVMGILGGRTTDEQRIDSLESEMHKILNDPSISSNMIQGMIADVIGVQSVMTSSNAAMRRLDNVLGDLTARLADVRAWEAHNDDAPPHGIQRPTPEDVKRAQMAEITNSRRAKADREAERKRREREMMRTLSPRVIEAVPCTACGAKIGRPCKGPSGAEFGFGGHTHLARREAYQLGVAKLANG